MASRKLKFALFGNIYQSRKSASIQELMSCLAAHGAEVCFEKLFYEYLVSSGKVKEGGAEVFSDGDFTADFVISMGGDGTLLRAASHVGGKGIEEHTALTVEADGRPLQGPCHALNDIAVLKRDNASMITIHAKVGGESLVTYQADGLIVSTPTGSTAYSLSNGGPIIVPRTGTVCLTPVAPHSLNIRPVVLPDDMEIELSVESRSHNFLIAVDGQSEKCAEGTRLVIRKAPYAVKIVKRNGHSYFATLREKMMWGADMREEGK